MDRGGVSSNGKVILFGEHAVVHGHRALAVGLPRAMVLAGVTRGGGGLRVTIPAWPLRFHSSERSILGRVARVVWEALPGPGLELELDARLWPAAGLGSSAAMSVLLVKAVAAARGVELGPEEVRALAHRCEEEFHGSPSGVDDAVAVYGGLCLFSKAGLPEVPRGFDRVDDTLARARLPIPGLVIADSRRPRRTVEMVRRVAMALEERPKEVAALFRDMDLLLDQGLRGALEGDWRRLGEAMTGAHRLLARLGVSTARLDAMVGRALDAGALGCKLTGAGGGGCVVALAPGAEGRVAAALEAMGCRVMVPGSRSPGP